MGLGLLNSKGVGEWGSSSLGFPEECCSFVLADSAADQHMTVVWSSLD